MKYIKEYVDFEDWDDEEGDDMPDEFKGYENFYNFLVDKNILDKWLYNILKNVKIFLYNNNLNSFINNAFDWDETSEGAKYWNKINDDWKNMIT